MPCEQRLMEERYQIHMINQIKCLIDSISLEAIYEKWNTGPL